VHGRGLGGGSLWERMEGVVTGEGSRSAVWWVEEVGKEVTVAAVTSARASSKRVTKSSPKRSRSNLSPIPYVIKLG
jgi:hypothetical protein